MIKTLVVDGGFCWDVIVGQVYVLGIMTGQSPAFLYISQRLWCLACVGRKGSCNNGVYV